jgi:hypothetical protein
MEMNMKQLKQLVGVLLVTVLTACGGGGGNPGTSTGSGSGTGTGGGTTPPPVVTKPAITLTIQNSNKAIVNTIAVGGTYSAVATVVDGAGVPVAGKLVSFAVSSALATLTPNTALTDLAGVAKISVAPASISSAGAASLSASATVGTDAVSASTDFAVSASSLTLSTINAGSLNLQSGGNTPLSVTALIGGAPASANPVSITYRVSCGRIDNTDATITGVGKTTNGSGVATATYSAVDAGGSPCSGLVTVNADSVGASAPSLTLTVAAPIANAINFITATPGQIFVKGSGSAEQSLVKFKVLTATSTPSANTNVNFSLITNPGGVSLSATSGTSDSNGEVTVSVFSGTIPGPVKVRANLASDPAVFSETQSLTVASGPPSQRYMSLSAATFNIEGANRDGISTTLTVRLADRQGNPVADGTVVNFTAEGGQVASSCTTALVNGISLCTVLWSSQNPRPSGGRVSVLAFTAGTKDYVDVNGNNKFDLGSDTLVDIGDAYRDDNEDGVYNPGEFLLPAGGSNVCSGSGGPFPSRTNTCDGSLSTTVRQQLILLNSSSAPAVIVRTNSGFTSVDFKLQSFDYPLVPMPAGTTVTAQAVDNTTNALTCSVGTILNNVVRNVTPTTNLADDLSTSHVVGLKDCAAGDTIEVKVTTPASQVYTQTFTL